MEVEAHEFEPRPFNSKACDGCDFGKKHPVHSVGRALGISDSPIWVDIPRAEPKFVTKDSGKREEFDSGMVRDTQDDKPRFDLLLPIGVPYGDQFLTRVAGLLARGAEKYAERNWEMAQGEVELTRFKASALRHLMQYLAGETDEDHASAVVFNLMGAHLVEWKLKNESR